jgi:phosphate:Na+ symporter
MERISDHCSNIGVYVLAKLAQKDTINRHEYIKRIHKGETSEYVEAMEKFQKKYINPQPVN